MWAKTARGIAENLASQDIDIECRFVRETCDRMGWPCMVGMVMAELVAEIWELRRGGK